MRHSAVRTVSPGGARQTVRGWIAVTLLLPVLACSRDRAAVLDKVEVLERQSWWDNRDWDWYAEHIPFFESPDPEIDATYYYRWELVTKHLTYGSPEVGYVFTEFMDRPFWSGRYGAISCPLGHQFYEICWLKNRRIIEDFARFWLTVPDAKPRTYSNWYGDAMWAVYQVLGDPQFIRHVFPFMERQYQGWVDERFDEEHQMFRWVGAWDGMETNINSRQTDDPFGGGEGYRPTLNSYMYADALALSRAAALLGDTSTADDYAERAARLKRRVQDELWDPTREFFFHQFAHGERGGIVAKSLTHETGAYAGSPHGRELLGYVPWQFNLPDPGYEAAWKFLMDPDFFFAPFGPTTVERHDPLFFISPQCCVWSGNQWPYATAQTLVAMANLLNNYEQEVVHKDDYYRLLRIYSLDQRLAGRPFVAEAANPDNGSWEGHNTLYHSEHYFHSSYVDLIITGLVGLRPRADDTLEINPLIPDDWDYFALEEVAYHDHRLAVWWDRDGSRYGRGSGLIVMVDGERAATLPSIGRLRVALPDREREPAEVARPHNVAAHNDGGFYPHISASFSAPTTPPLYATDGNYWYHRLPSNRWTTVGSPNEQDWIAVDFGIARAVESVKLYFLPDDGVIAPPVRYEVQRWRDGAWTSIPGQRRHPTRAVGQRANVVRFPEITASRLRVVLTHALGKASGLTELEVWGHAELPLPAPTGPIANLALATGPAGFPKTSASFTSRFDSLAQVADGRVAFTRYSRNRWTAYESPNATDWIQLDFGEPRTIHRLDIYLWGDDRGVKAPTDYVVETWTDGRWTSVVVTDRRPRLPATWARNSVVMEPVTSPKIRVVFEHALPAVTGVTEIEVWGDRADARRPEERQRTD